VTAAADLSCRFAAGPAAVRTALAAVADALDDRIDRRHARLTVELVLAEVLNNILEHACTDRADHRIGLDLWIRRDRVCCVVFDDGRAMPQGAPPRPTPLRPHALPERGFGWRLIRGLTSEFGYLRVAGCNVLILHLPLPKAQGAAAHLPDGARI